MKKIITYIVSFVMVLSIIGQATNIYNTATYADTKPGFPKAPDIVGKSAILINPVTGTILYEKDSHKKMYPASITKIMTALLTLENCKMNEEIVYSKKNIESLTWEDSNIECKVGEKMTVKDGLYALMLASANETATALAEHISGSTENFTKLMNDRAKQAGATDTHFANANGLHDDNHYVTAYDMAMIMNDAIQYPAFLDVIHATEYTIPANNKRKKPYPSTQRHMMIHPTSQYYDADVIGGKTGYTDQAGKCLVTYAKRGNVPLISVVLKSDGDVVFDDTKKLLDYGFDNFEFLNIYENDTRFNTNTFDNLASPFASTDKTITVDKDTFIMIPKGVSIADLDTEVSFHLTDDSFATITYKYGNHIMGSAKMKYINSGSYSEKEISTTTESITEKKVTPAKKEKTTQSETKKTNKPVNSSHLLTIIIIVFVIIIIVSILTAIMLHRRKLNRIRAMKRRRNR